MPNWCNNNLIVSGPKKIINSLFKDNKFSLQEFFPCPQELLDLPSPSPKEFAESNLEKYGSKDWYDWCVSNWGVKWDPGPFIGEIENINRKESKFYCNFDSAWAPPTKAFKKLAETYPELKINLEYFESGCKFFGVLSAKDGEVEDNYQEYDDAASLEEALEICPCDLAEMEVDYLKELEEEEAAKEESSKEEELLKLKNVKKSSKSKSKSKK